MKPREAEVLLSQGTTVIETLRKLEISEQTYYRWRKEYGGNLVLALSRSKNVFYITQEFFSLILILAANLSHFAFRDRDECYPKTDKEICATEEDMDHEMTGVEILFSMSHNSLTIVEEYVQ